MPDYSKCLIYKLCCKDPTIKDIYVGSTCNKNRRKNQHKNACNNPNDHNYNYYVYQFIRENGGFENFDLIMIEEYPCDNKLQKETRERYYIELLKPTLNKTIPTRTIQEYYQDNKEKILKMVKIYSKDNKEKIEKYEKEYYEKNKEKLDQKRNANHTCECGGKYKHKHKSEHIKSKKHQNFLNQ